MSPHKEWLVSGDKDISVYNKELIKYIPDCMRIGGYIIVVNKHNKEKRHKAWKWYKNEDGMMVNDKKYVIDMLSSFVRQLHINNQ